MCYVPTAQRVGSPIEGCMLFEGNSFLSLGIADLVTASVGWDDPFAEEPRQSITMKTNATYFAPDHLTCFPTPEPTAAPNSPTTMPSTAPTLAPTTLAPTQVPTTLAPTVAPADLSLWLWLPLAGIIATVIASILGLILGTQFISADGVPADTDESDTDRQLPIDLEDVSKGNRGGDRNLRSDEWWYM